MPQSLSKGESPGPNASREAMDICEHVITEMGAELHDDLMQKLTIFRLYLDRLDRSKSDPDEVDSILVSMNADFLEIVQSIRRISRRLMPSKTENDSFEKGISMLCQNMERPGGGTIHFDWDGHEHQLSAPAEIYLYRIVQELIHNAIKHSSAWHVWVRITSHENKLTIEVEDDGTDFSKVHEAISSLQQKHNTLRMRSEILGAAIQYRQGKNGLVASISYSNE